jgi:cytidine deaminase
VKSAKRRGGFDAAELLREADRARRASYAPYSRFRVGAALLGESGRVHRGCNVENASLGLSVCAERNAVWSAVASGERDFLAVAVSAGPGEGASPCGACRQVLHEFAADLWVIWREASGRVRKRRLSALLPEPFDLRRRGRR